MNALINATRAELTRLRKWPAVWIAGGAWLLLCLLFGYVFNYVSYKSGETSFSTDGQTSADLLAEVLPQGLPSVLLQGVPMFGSAIAVVLGALVAGSGFSWGTWKSIFTQSSSKVAAIGGSLLAVGIVMVGLVVGQVAVSMGASVLLAAVEGESSALPPFVDLAEAAGSGLLIMVTFAVIGFTIGLLAKGPALAIGLSLVWVLVVENLLRGVAGTLDVIETLTQGMPGTAAGSLAGGLIGQGNAPGLLTSLSTSTASLSLVAYLVIAATVAMVITKRRDVA